MDTQPQTLRLLVRLLEHEFSSPFRYLEDAAPYLGSLSAVRIDRVVQRVAQQDREHVRRLSEWVYARGGVPPAADPQIARASEHDVTVEHLLPALIRFKQKAAELYQTVCPQVSDPDARTPLNDLARQKRQQLQELEALQPLVPDRQ